MLDRKIICKCGRIFKGDRSGKISCCARCGRKYTWYDHDNDRRWLPVIFVSHRSFDFEAKPFDPEKKRSRSGYRPFEKEFSDDEVNK